MLDYSTIPNPHMKGALQRYMEQGIAPGDFMQALLQNNLKRTVEQADDTNIKLLPQWEAWLYNEAPMSSWGSADDYEFWVKRKQLKRADPLWKE